MASAICSRSSSSRRVNGCWMCPRRWRRGCGCWGRADRTRTTRTTAIRSRSRRCTHRTLQQVARADHAGVLRLLAKRNKELGSARTRTACRLHALLVELVPGGIPKEITANRAAAVLASVTPAGPVEATRHELALEHLEDLRRIDEQMRASQAAHRRRGQSLRHDHDRGVRHRSGRRRDRRRPDPRCQPLREPRPLRRLQRHRSHRGRLRWPRSCIGCRGAGTAN